MTSLSTEMSKEHIGTFLSFQMVIVVVIIAITIRVCQEGIKQKWR